MELTLSQKIVIYGFSVPFAILIWGFILIKLADFAEEGWRYNNRKKKWVVCLAVAAAIVLRSVDYLFVQ
jgi:hypothetical protein